MNDDEEIPVSEERKGPKFLYITYVIVILFGIFFFLLYWNGSQGWPNRKAWLQLQKAAHTTFPREKNEF